MTGLHEPGFSGTTLGGGQQTTYLGEVQKLSQLGIFSLLYHQIQPRMTILSVVNGLTDPHEMKLELNSAETLEIMIYISRISWPRLRLDIFASPCNSIKSKNVPTSESHCRRGGAMFQLSWGYGYIKSLEIIRKRSQWNWDELGLSKETDRNKSVVWCEFEGFEVGWIIWIIEYNLDVLRRTSTLLMLVAKGQHLDWKKCLTFLEIWCQETFCWMYTFHNNHSILFPPDDDQHTSAHHLMLDSCSTRWALTSH